MTERRGACLVTGGARRVGRAICLALAGAGYDIALHYNRSCDQAGATARDIKNLGADVDMIACDLKDSGAVEGLLKAAHSRFPGLCVLVNSASSWVPVGFRESSLSQLEENLAVHVAAPYLLSRDFANLVGHGTIVNIVDTAVMSNQTNFFPYLLSKKALHELTGLMAYELAPAIRVNAVAPGMVLPAEGAAQESYKRRLKDNPLEHEGTPEDVASAVVYLVNAKHVTGQTIFVDGGEHL